MCFVESFSNYDLGIFALHDNAEDRNRKILQFIDAFVTTGITEDNVKFNNQKHTKYTESATLYTVKCRKSLIFTKHTLIYWETWLCRHCYRMWKCWRRRYPCKIRIKFVRSLAYLGTPARAPVSFYNATLFSMLLLNM